MPEDKLKGAGIHTLCIHSGEGIDQETRALRRPIHTANSYELPVDIEKLLEVFSWDHLDKFQYTREHSATPRYLETRLAALEQSEDCVVTASGMGAVSAVLFTLLNAGDHIVASEVCYTGTQKLLSVHLPRFGVEVSMVDTTEPDAVRRAMRSNTRAVFVETPGNPIVAISDIEKIAAIAHEAGAMMIVDSTWSGSDSPEADSTGGRCGDPQRHQIFERSRRCPGRCDYGGAKTIGRGA